MTTCYFDKNSNSSEWELVNHQDITYNGTTLTCIAVSELPIIHVDHYYIQSNDRCELVVIDHIKYGRNGSPSIPIVEVLLNCCHGEFCISTKAKELYNLKRLCMDPTFEKVKHFDEMVYRTDPILISCFKELGEEFNGNCGAFINIASIPKKYKKYFYIVNCKGIESISINILRYEEDLADAMTLHLQNIKLK